MKNRHGCIPTAVYQPWPAVYADQSIYILQSTRKTKPSVIHYLAQGISYPPKLITGAYSCMAGLCITLDWIPRILEA